jgi:short-subunit dehydrogenase
MENSLHGKTVWLTGATSGIGEALARQCAEAGARVILCARRAEALESVRLRLVKPEQHRCLVLDLAKPREVLRQVKEEIARGEEGDILINNAGIGQRSVVMDTEFAVDEAVITTNVLGTIALTKALLPSLLAAKGAIVVVSSIVGRVSTPKRSAYAASKHALHGWFEGLRAETFNQGLTILMACPGYTCTEFSIQAMTGDGSAQGFRDATHETGMKPDYVAQKLLKALQAGKAEVCIAQARERLAWYLSFVAPWLVRRLVRKVNTT